MKWVFWVSAAVLLCLISIFNCNIRLSHTPCLWQCWMVRWMKAGTSLYICRKESWKRLASSALTPRIPDNRSLPAWWCVQERGRVGQWTIAWEQKYSKLKTVQGETKKDKMRREQAQNDWWEKRFNSFSWCCYDDNCHDNKCNTKTWEHRLLPLLILCNMSYNVYSRVQVWGHSFFFF